MSLESNLKRIADALDELVRTVQQDINPVITTQSSVAIPPAPPAPAAPAAAPAAPAQLTDEEMNATMVAEFKRIGDRAPIDAAMTALGIAGVSNLTAEQQQQLLTAVRAIGA